MENLKNILLTILAGLGAFFGLYKIIKEQGANEERQREKDNENKLLHENLEIQKDKISDISIADDYIDKLCIKNNYNKK